MLSRLTELVHHGCEATQKHLVPDYLTRVQISPEPAILMPLKLGMCLWLEPWDGEGKGDVAPNTPRQLSASGFVSVEKGKSLGGQKHKWNEEQRKATLLLWSKSSLFSPVLSPLSGNCPVLGAFRTERFVCLCHYTLFCQWSLVRAGQKLLCEQTKSMFFFDSQDIKSRVESKKQFAMWHRVTCPAVVSDLYPNEKPYKHLP